MPVAHKQGADRSGSEDLDENFNVSIIDLSTSFTRPLSGHSFWEDYMLDYQQFSKEYTVRPLIEDDLEAMLALCLSNPLYYEHLKMQPTLENLREDLTALPPDKTMEDKYFVGFFSGERLVALLDLIDGYPQAGTAFIGWFMVDAAEQGKGSGSRIISDVVAYCRQAGFGKMRLGCVKINPQSKHFWQKMGFSATGESKVREENVEVILMERECSA